MSIVIPEQNKLSTLINWVNATRATSPLLDDEADTLLANLNYLSARYRAIATAESRPAALGIYGHSHEGKAHLLRTLTAGEDGRLVVNIGEKTVDYLNQINPGHSPLLQAIRFVSPVTKMTDGYPLTLHLFSEADAVQLVITHYLAGSGAKTPDRTTFEQHLVRLRSLCQPQNQPGMRPEDVLQVARSWQSQVAVREQQIDDALWQKLADIVPRLDTPGRALAFSVFWGEQRELTQFWLGMAEALLHLGYACEVHAPQSLLIDNFSLPVDGFLTRSELHDDDNADVLVRPVINGEPAAAVNLSLSVLRHLCAELELPVPHQTLDGVDVLDIPGFCQTDGSDLLLTKRRFLLEWYRQRLQPDVLLICNAAPSRAAIPELTRLLWRWVETTQPVKEGAMPGLVWAITPHDHRFSHGEHLDEAIQQLLGKPGKHWGTLQALDSRNLQRLIEWLSQALDGSHHAGRMAGLRGLQDTLLKQTFSRFSSNSQNTADQDKEQIAQTVRALQRIAARHGELLEGLLPHSLVQQVLVHESLVEPLIPDTPFDLQVDLFAEPEQVTQSTVDSVRSQGSETHRAWINHLRHWTRRADIATHFGIPGEALHHLGEILVVTSYRLSLSERLEKAAQSAARQQSELGNFISWLGYDTTPVEARPASRVQQGRAIFAPAPQAEGRLTKLGERPEHAATHFVYDWLVALYTRALENTGYRHPLDISDEDRRTLQKLLD